MRSITVKLLSLLLAACMILPLAACAKNEDNGKETDNNAVESSTDEAFPSVSRTDYGKTFTATFCGDMFHEGYYFNKEAGRDEGNDLDDRIFERVERIRDYLGVEIVVENGGAYTEYSNKFKNAINAGDDAYQLIMTHVYMDVANLITGNFLLDMNELESCDFSADYWNRELMDQLAINDKYYCGYNDFCLSNCYVIAFNKDLAAKYEGIDDVYSLVRNNQWTLDKLMSISSLVSSDYNGDGKMDANDTYGFAGLAWVPMISFVTASDIPLIAREPDTDRLYVSPPVDNLEKFTSLSEKMLEFYKSSYSFMWQHTATAEQQIHLPSGRLLFEMLNNFGLIRYKEEDIRVGVLPYPLFDTRQSSYRTLNWNGVLGVASTAATHDTQMVSDVMEMLAYFSAPVRRAFYETLLGARIAEAPEDVEMLNIIWSSQVSDLGLVFANVCSNMDHLLYMLPNMVTSGNLNISSQFKSNVRSAEKSLERMFKQKDK